MPGIKKTKKPLEKNPKLQRQNISLRKQDRDFTERKQWEAQIQNVAREWTLTFDAIGDAISYLDSKGKILRCNKAMANFLEKPFKKIIGQYCWEIVHGTNKQINGCPLGFVRRTRTRTNTVLQIGNRWFNITVDPILDVRKQFIGAIHIMSDITERRKAVEKKLAANEELFRQMVETIHEVFWLRERDTRRIIYISPSCKTLWGRSAREMTREGWSFMENVHPEDKERVSISRSALYDKNLPFDEEYRLVRPDDSIIWVRARTYPVFDQKGKVIRYVGSAEDITERKKTEDNLTANEERFRSLFENMREGFAYCRMLFDGNGHPQNYIYLDVNKAFQTLTGLKDVIGKKVSEVIPGILKSNPELLEIYGRVSLTGRSEKLEVYVPALEKWFSISVYSPKKEYFVAVFDVITDRKKAEEEIRWRTALLEAQINSIIEGVLIVDEKGNKIIQNQRCTDLWKIPRDIAANNDDKQQVEFVKNRTRNPEQFVEKVVYLYTHPKETSRDEVEFKDGMILDRYSAPVIGKDGTNFGRIWVFRDITEQKRAETELKVHAAQMEAMMDGSIAALTSAIEIRDPYTVGHERRVAQLVCAIARKMGLPEIRFVVCGLPVMCMISGKSPYL